MLCIQCPGSLIIIYFLIFISKESVSMYQLYIIIILESLKVSTWLSYLAAAIQQLILLVLLFYYDRKARKSVDILMASAIFLSISLLTRLNLFYPIQSICPLILMSPSSSYQTPTLKPKPTTATLKFP